MKTKLHITTIALIIAAISFSKAQTAYITNSTDGTVSVINVATNVVTSTITVGGFPWGVSVSADGTKVYVTNDNDGTVSVINTATHSVSATVTVGAGPVGAAVTPDGTKVYVTNGGTNTVSVITTAANTVTATITVGSFPYGVAVTPDGSTVYVTNSTGTTVSVINTATNTVATTITVGNHPYGVTVTPDGSKVYVSNLNDNTISVISTATNAVTATITVMSAPRGVCVSPDGSKLFVANNSSNSVNIINTTTNVVADTITVDHLPNGISINPAGSKVYVANYNTNDVSVIDVATHTVSATTPVGTNPLAFGNFISIYPTTFTITTGSIVSADCAGSAISIPYTLAGTFTAGNVFTAQLSDATGSFATPVNIGTLSATTSNTISATIPSNTSAGSGYRIRVVSSAPLVTGADNGSNIIVNALPVATFSYTGTPYCADTINPFPTFSGGGTAGTFSSTAGFVFISTSTGGVDLLSSTSGTYMIRNTIPPSGGCPSVSDSSTITITEPPVATFSYTGTPYCQNATNPFPTFIGGGTAGTFSSTAGFVFISTNNGEVDLLNCNPGTYTVKNRIPPSGGCPAISATASITINTSPVVNVNSPTICAGQTASLTANGATTYSWSTGATSTGVNTADASPTVTSTYTVTGTYFGCNDTAVSTVTVNCTVGINEITDNANITIAPNPFTSQTTITFSEEQTNTLIKVRNVLGEEIKSVILSGARNLTLEKGTMSPGIYFVEISDANKNVVNKKVVVQ